MSVHDPVKATQMRATTGPPQVSQDGARGLLRVQDFSWERSVRRVREIYDEVLAR